MNLIYRFPAILTIILLATAGSCKESKTIGLEDLLNDMINREQVTHFPEPEYHLKQFSSYDRGSKGPDQEGWFANADYTQFIGEENKSGRREFILFDHQGPGAIVRWWMTFAGGGSYNGTIRIYLDNSEIPFVEENVLKVVSGQLLAGEPLSSSVSPETDYYRRGHNLYLPIPYSKQCKITYECDSIRLEGDRWRPSIYYNINYRDYNDDVKVTTIDSASLKRFGSLIETVNKNLITQPEHPTLKLQEEFVIEPGKSSESKIVEKGIAISGISLKLESPNINQALRSTVLEISFDGIRTVWVPAGDFFGTGFEEHQVRTWYSRVCEDRVMESSWIMPFRENATIRIINYGEQNVSVDLSIYTSQQKWKENTMYFGSSWHEYNRIQSAGSEHVGGTGKHIDINYVDIEGKGVYMGDAITVFNTADAWWGEGDEKIYVDNESFPSSIGTGTEDYYGYAWCRPEIFSHPFIAQPTGAGNFHPGMTVNLRYRILDAIPFSQGIDSDIELWHWVPTVMNYALTSYYYAMPGYTTNIIPDEETVKLSVPSKKSDLLEQGSR